MKYPKYIAVLLVGLSLAVLTGCKNFTPQQASTATTLGVYALGRNNPKITATMRQV